MDFKGRLLYMCRKDEVARLFDEQFWYIYEVWQHFHAGLGLPTTDKWTKHDPDFLNTIMQMEIHFKNNFSIEIMTTQYLEAIIKRMDNIGKMLSKRR